MANFIPKIGLKSNLPALQSGAFLVTTDEGMAYVDTTSGERVALTNTFYGVCSTEASAQSKVINNIVGFQLREGVTVNVKFTNTNSTANPTLNINGTGPIPIVQYGTSAVSTGAATNGWQAGAMVQLTYDGVSWVRDQGYNTNSTYTITSVWSGTAASTTAKATSNASYYALREGNIFEITFRYSNSVPGPITLNVNSTGARPIYINGEPSSATNYTLPAGKYLVYYDGNAYQIRTDGKVPIDISGTAASALQATQLTTTGTTSQFWRGDNTWADVIQKEYTGNNGITVTSADVIEHTNSIASNSSFPTGTSVNANGGSFTVRDIKYDAQGHITGYQDREITLSQVIPTIDSLNGITTVTTGTITSPLQLSVVTTGTTATISGSISSAANNTLGVVMFSSAVPADLGTASPGTSGAAARADHVHNMPTKADIGLSQVEDVALSTWAGSSAITTLGTITSGNVPWSRLTSVPNASTSTAGIVQLSNEIDSNATNMAATPNAVKAAYDLAASKSNTTGTVIQIDTGAGLIGGPITSSGTIALKTVNRLDTTSTINPNPQTSFTVVDSITTNTYGQITSINVKSITLPEDTNTEYTTSGTYNSTSNPIATVETVTSALANLLYSSSGTADKTITNITQTDGKINVVYNDISIAPSQINATIPNSKLQNSSITIAGENVALGSGMTAQYLREKLGLSQALKFIGITSTTMSDGLNIQNITIAGNNVTAQIGDVVLDSTSSLEYLWTGNSWERLGPDGSYAMIGQQIKFTPKGTINNHDYTPEGTVSTPVFSGTTATLSFSATPTGSITTSANNSGNYTPAGTVSKPSWTGTQDTINTSGIPTGNITITYDNSTGVTHNYTPEGSINTLTFNGTASNINVSGLASGSNAKSAVTIKATTATIYSMNTTGSVTQGTSASFTQGNDNFTTNTPTAIDTSKFNGGSYSHTGWNSGSLPSLEMSVVDEVLSFTFGQGTLPVYGTDTFTSAKLNAGFYTAGTSASFTQGIDNFSANTPTIVTLPTRSSQTVWTGYTTGVNNTYAEAQTWTPTTSTFTGSYTPSGSITQPVFTGTGVKIDATFSGTTTTFSGTFTPRGSVSQPIFNGTTAQFDFNGNAFTSSISYQPSGTNTTPTFSGTTTSLTHTFTGQEETITL